MSPVFTVETCLHSCILWLMATTAVIEGAVQIKQCSQHGWLEILETGVSAPYITCQGLDAALSASWRLVTDGQDQRRSFCGLFGQECNSTSGDIRVFRRGDSYANLYIVSKVREMAGNGSVFCAAVDGNGSLAESESGSESSASSSCRINVVAPATLTDCQVTKTADRTLAGSCRFSLAFSSNDTYACTWTQTRTNGQQSTSTNIAGLIRKTPETVSGRLYFGGTCSFTSPRLPDGQYSYTVHFSPGQDATEEGPRISIGSPPVTPGTTSTTTQNTPPGSEEESSSTIVYVIIGVTAGVVVIITIIIGVICIKRSPAKGQHDKPSQQQQRTPANHFTPFHEDKSVWYNDRNRQNSLQGTTV